MHEPRLVRSAQALLLLLALSLTAAPAVAQQASTTTPSTSTPTAKVPLSKTELRRVGLLLGDYHNLPTKAALLAASPRAQEALTLMASRRGDAGPYRLRAIAALGMGWPDAASFALLTGVARDTAEPGAVRREAMTTLAIAFDGRAVPTIAPALSSADIADRLTAVEALRVVKDPSAQTTLKAALKTEHVAVVRQAIERATRVVE